MKFLTLLYKFDILYILMKVIFLKKVTKFIKIFIIIISLFGINKINVKKDNGIVLNDNYNKVLDLSAMAIKVEEIRLKDLYYPLDTYVGYLTGYVADCPLCGGTLGCTGQDVLTDRITTYQDKDYGTVDIMASSTSLKCGSIVQYNLDGKKRTAIVLDRGVVGTNLDLLVDNEDKAYGIGKRYISYDILRFGWSRSNS